jgi:hypothetical protein
MNVLFLYMCPTARMETPVDLFIAYSHKDKAIKDELKDYLSPLIFHDLATVWDDYEIEAGANWDEAIKSRLKSARIIVLLVSHSSLASRYFYGEEVRLSLDRRARGEAVVVPVIVRNCNWKLTPLGELEAMPDKGRPINT